MSRHGIRLAILLLLACSALADSAGTTRAWGEPTLVSNVTFPNSITRLKTDGWFVVWIKYSSQSPGSTRSVFDGVDRWTGEPVSIDIGSNAEYPSTPWAPLAIDLDIDGGLVALSTTWNHYHGAGPHGVFAKNLLSGQQWQLSSAKVPGPVGVSGSSVYWVERVPGYHGDSRDVIWMQDVADLNATPMVFYTAVNAAIQVTDLSVDDGGVVWQMRDEATSRWWLVARTLDGQELTIAEGEQRIPFDLSGDMLVYREAGGLTVRYLTDGV